MDIILDLVKRAADQLVAAGDDASAHRLRAAVEIVGHRRSPADVPADMRIPLLFMSLALALMDVDGNGANTAACALQAAIDKVEGLSPPASPASIERHTP